MGGDSKMEVALELFDFILEGMDPSKRPPKEVLHEILRKQFKKTINYSMMSNTTTE
jgi:hypothetical protein